MEIVYYVLVGLALVWIISAACGRLACDAEWSLVWKVYFMLIGILVGIGSVVIVLFHVIPKALGFEAVAKF